jgi:predicted CopG family antitoxin
MTKKLTITLDERVYNGLSALGGSRKISEFIQSLVWPHVIAKDLDRAYREMAADERRESEAREWAEAMIGDVADEAR